MTSKDTAGDKLVASIRKTKAAAAGGDKPAKKKVIKKTARRATPKAVQKTSSRTAANTPDRKAQLVDLFQSGRRVWPD